MSQDKIGQNAPQLQLNFLDGSPFVVPVGEPLLISFFSSACPWCVSEMPRLGKVYDNVKMQGVQVPLVGIVTGEATPESAVQFALDCGLDMPLALDEGGAVSAVFGVQRVPSVVLIDANGAIARVYEGASEQLTGIVEQALFAAARGDATPNFELVGNGCGA